MNLPGARRNNMKRVKRYTFKNQEEWRESAIEKGFAGIKSKDIHNKEHGRQWLKDLIHWMEFKGLARSQQNNMRKLILAEIEKDK